MPKHRWGECAQKKKFTWASAVIASLLVCNVQHIAAGFKVYGTKYLEENNKKRGVILPIYYIDQQIKDMLQL